MLTDPKKVSTEALSFQELEGDLKLPADWEKYRIDNLLGEGGMARVYLAHDPHLKRFR